MARWGRRSRTRTGGSDGPAPRRDTGPATIADARADVDIDADTEPTVELHRSPSAPQPGQPDGPACDGDATVVVTDREPERDPSGWGPSSRGAAERDEAALTVARRRFVRRRWAGRWLAWRLVVIAVLGVGVVAVATWLVFFSAVLAVEGVRVEGNEVLSAAAVRRAADVPLGAPLATADLDAVTARVARLRAVRTVDVSRSWPDRVRIAVRERRAVAVVERDGTGRLRGVDADGVAFRGYAARPTGLPRIRVGRRAGQEAVAEAAAVAGALPADVARRVAFIRVQTVDTISLRLRDGRTVRWGSAEDSADKSRVLAVLLGQQAGYYDVSVPGRPVIRR